MLKYVFFYLSCDVMYLCICVHAYNSYFVAKSNMLMAFKYLLQLQNVTYLCFLSTNESDEF